MTPDLRALIAKWKTEMAGYLRAATTAPDETVCAMNRASAATCRRFLFDLDVALASRGDGGPLLLSDDTPAIWSCKIGECDRGALPRGSDGPMRTAVHDAYVALVGTVPRFIFSGWGATLTTAERDVVEEGPPNQPTQAGDGGPDLRAWQPSAPPSEAIRVLIAKWRQTEADIRGSQRNWMTSVQWNDLTVIANGFKGCADELEADLSQEPSRWQPIATAPKDGTRLLLARQQVLSGELTMVSGCWNSGGAMHMPHWMSAVLGFQPTHWMPLPLPPAQEPSV